MSERARKASKYGEYNKDLENRGLERFELVRLLYQALKVPRTRNKSTITWMGGVKCTVQEALSSLLDGLAGMQEA